MSKLSLLDKLGILVKLSVSAKKYWIVLIVLLVFGIILAFTNKKNETRNKVLYFIMTICILAILIASYHASLGKMMNFMMNHFFIAVYFPNVAIYLAAIIAMNIIVWISIFSYKTAKPIRFLNITIYIIMNYFMALLLETINKNKLDIFDQSSLYGNKSALAMIELSSLVFMIWIIFLVLYKVILIYVRKDYKPKVKRIIVRKQVKKLPENYEPILSPERIYGKIPSRNTIVLKEEKQEEKPEEKVIDTSEKTEDEILLEHFSKQFTLDDYKLFSRLLREHQERETQRKEQERKEEQERLEKEQEERQKQLEEEQRQLDEMRKEQEQLEAERKKEEEFERERQKQIERQKKEDAALEYLLQQTLLEEEREKKKVSELESLYR